MVSKLQALREGRAVEIREGISARLNPQNKTMEFSTGEIRHIGDDPDYFPKTDIERQRSFEKEKIEREIESFPGGRTAGQFAYQFGQKTALSGVKDWANYLTKTGDDYLARKQAEGQIGERISEESPILSGAATAASLIPDLAITKGMSGAKAIPALAGIGAGPRILDEPGEVAGEATIGGLGGYLIDKGAAFLGKVAGRRGASREISREASEVQALNAAERERISQLNAQQQKDFLKAKEAISRENSALQHQHNLELNARQNRMIQAKNDYDRAKALQSAEKEKAKIDYEISKKEYESALKNIPVLQREAQEESGRMAVSSVKEVEGLFPGGAKISISELGAGSFIKESIQKSSRAGTKEASQASKIISSLFPEGETILASNLSKRMESLEGAIARASPEVREILTEFKMVLSNTIPNQVSEAIAFQKGFPILKRGIVSDFRNALSESGLNKAQIFDLMKEIEPSLSRSIEQISSKDFQNKLRSGQLSRDLIQSVLSQEKYLSIKFPYLKNLEKKGLKKILEQSAEYKGAIAEYEVISEAIAKKLDKTSGDAFIHGLEPAEKGLRKSQRNLQGIGEMPSPVPVPEAPKEPIFPPSPLAPETPPLPPSPQAMEAPQAPFEEVFSPTPAPMLPPASGSAEKIGDFFEKSPQEYLGKGGKFGPLGNLAGLKYLLGGKAAGAAAGFYGLKALTSPTAGGAAARMTFRQGGIGAIEQWMQSYSSYRNGILDDPRERRSVNREIEDDSTIPLGQKAIFQSKINRGKPLSIPLD